jgi:succinate dehydrogenase / fumarate reductase cytochrome b subunit
MGFILELKNRRSRAQKYYSFKGNANSSWMSRNMIYSGVVVLSFLGLHFYDFWIPEMQYKYVEFLPENPDRYYEELIHKFESPTRVILYNISFIFLSLHLLHGFSSSFQTMGFNNKYTYSLKFFTFSFSIIIPLGFILISVFHYLNIN